MHCCEFCSATFQPRPQVKHPRACANCQKSRQQANDNAWSFKRMGHSDSIYHQLQKKMRRERIQGISLELSKYLKVGCAFHGKQIDCNVFELYLFQFLCDLGIRKINKFWLL